MEFNPVLIFAKRPRMVGGAAADPGIETWCKEPEVVVMELGNWIFVGEVKGMRVLKVHVDASGRRLTVVACYRCTVCRQTFFGLELEQFRHGCMDERELTQ